MGKNLSQGADSRLWQWVFYNMVRLELVCLSHHTPGCPLLCRVSWFHSTAGGNGEAERVKTRRALFWEKEPGRKARKAPEKQLKNVLWYVESANRLVGCWAESDYREDVWLMDCSPRELALKRGLANHSHCHMYRDSLPDAHTQSQVISHHPHTLLPSCIPGFWQRESHSHARRDAEACMISQEQQSEEVRVALGIRHLFVNLTGLVVLYIFDSL